MKLIGFIEDLRYFIIIKYNNIKYTIGLREDKYYIFKEDKLIFSDKLEYRPGKYDKFISKEDSDIDLESLFMKYIKLNRNRLINKILN